MSTREEHPIDEVFRRSLANAEVSPPPSVWAGIAATRRRRRWPQWFRLNGILLLLIPAAAWITYAAWLNDDGTPAASEGARAPIHGPIDGLGQTSISTEFATISDLKRSSLINDSVAPIALNAIGESRNTVIHSTKDRFANEAITSSAIAESRSTAVHPTGKTFANDAVTIAHDPISYTGELSEEGTERTNDDRVNGSDRHIVRSEMPDLGGTDATFFPPAPIRPAYAMLIGAPSTVKDPELYVLSKADWIASLVIGPANTRREWNGNDETLTNALKQADAPTTAYGFGILAGRKYRSGFGFATGLIHERSEREFLYTARRTEVYREVIPWIVTLDTEVFVSDIDTIEHVSVKEQRYTGIDRRTVYRVPIEGFYHRTAGRIFLGLRAGASIELTQVQQRSSLTISNEGDVVMTALDRKELRSRYPLMLCGSIGLDLGYSLAENWSLELSPLFTSGMAPLGSTAGAWAKPSRHALQLRLTHHFTKKTSRP